MRVSNRVNNLFRSLVSFACDAIIVGRSFPWEGYLSNSDKSEVTILKFDIPATDFVGLKNMIFVLCSTKSFWLII